MSTADTSQPDGGGGASQRSEPDSTVLGNYALVQKLGAGAMGTVYLAVDGTSHRTVALKVLARKQAQNPHLVKRFKAEAKAASQLQHENIIAVYDAGEEHGYWYIAFEYVQGQDVQTLLKQGPIPLSRSIDIVKQITRALQHAFEQNIVHRDIKPSNMLITRDGVVKLADLGLARTVGDTTDSGLTRAGTTVGTVDYMSPEQAVNSRSADTRSDIYSLGCSLFHMITGLPPFPVGNIINKLNAHAHQPRPDPREKNAAIPQAVVAVLHKMLAVDPNDRFQTPGELLQALESLGRKRAEKPGGAVDAETDDEGDECVVVVEEPGEKVAAEKRVAQKTVAEVDTSVEAKARGTDTHPARRRQTPPRATITPPRPKQASAQSETPTITVEPKFILIASAAVVVLLGFAWWGLRGDPDANATISAATESDGSDPDATNAPGGNSRGPARSPGPRGTQNGVQPQAGTQPPVSPGTSTAEDVTGWFLPVAASPTRNGEAEHLPGWLTNSPASASELEVWEVVQRPTRTGQFDELDTALRQLPPGGGIVELHGAGPHVVHGIQLQDRKTVVIRAAAGSQPVVVLRPDANRPAEALFEFTQGSLTLQGLHVLVHAEHAPTSNDLAAFSVRAANFAAVDCSLTLQGQRLGNSTAVRVSKPPAPNTGSMSRILLDNVVVRGHNQAVLRLDESDADITARNCFFVTGTAPVIGRLAGGTSAAVSANAFERTVRFLSTTACVEGRVMELSPGPDAARPLPTSIVTVNSVLTAGRDDANSVFAALDHWPPNHLETEGKSRFKGLSWTSQSSLLCGWKKLVEVSRTPALDVLDAAAWEKAWRMAPDRVHIRPQGLLKQPLVKIDEADPSGFEGDAVDLTPVVATDGGSPGCQFSQLTFPQPLALGVATAMADRPQRPVDRPSRKTTGANVVEIRLDNNEELSGRIQATAWDSGAVFVISGSGTHRAKRISIRDKSLRLQFVQDGPEPFVIAPDRLQSADRGDEAFLTVENGTIEILDGRFQMPRASPQTGLLAFLNVRNGSFVLENCRIAGSMLDNYQFNGLINWRSDSPESAPSSRAPTPGHFAVIADSYLSSPGKVLDADVRHRNVHCHNSVLVSLSDLIEFNISGFEPVIASKLDMRHCTLSATNSFFRIRATPLAPRAVSPLTLFVEETVFAPPVARRGGGPATPSVVACEESVLKNQQIAGRSHACGFATAVRRVLRAPAGSSSPFEADWQKAWPADQNLQLLVDPNAVELVGPLPDATAIQPSHFRLSLKSAAARSGENATAIGAALDAWPTKP